MGGKGRTEQMKLAGCGHGLAQLEEARGNVFDRIVAQAALKQIAELEEIINEKDEVILGLKGDLADSRSENEELRRAHAEQIELLKADAASWKFHAEMKDRRILALERVVEKHEPTLRKLRSRLGGRTSKHKQAEEEAYAGFEGFTKTGNVYTGDNAGRNHKHLGAKSIVSKIMLASEGSRDKAEDIIEAVLNHHAIKLIAADRFITRDTSADAETEDAILGELVGAIKSLKCSANGSANWRAYQCVLHALVPAEYPHPSLLADYLGVSYEKVKKIQKNKQDSSESWSWDFKVQQRKDAYEVQHAANIPIIKKWMDNNTQADPSNTKVKHSNTRGHHRNNKGTKRRECVQPGACVERPLRYQVQTDGDWYLSFAEAHPDIAAVTSINVFLRFREFHIIRPDSRTCLCVYHQVLLVYVGTPHSLSSLL